MDPEVTDSHFFLLPFRTYPENCIKICALVFELSCSQTNKQTDGQTNPGENITSLAEVIISQQQRKSLSLKFCFLRSINRPCSLSIEEFFEYLRVNGHQILDSSRESFVEYMQTKITSAIESDMGYSCFITQDKFLDKSLPCDTNSAIDAVLFLENLEGSNFIAETDHPSIPNQELQVDNTCRCQFSDISDDENCCKQLKKSNKNYFESNTSIKNHDMPEDRRAQLMKNKQESCHSVIKFCNVMISMSYNL